MNVRVPVAVRNRLLRTEARPPVNLPVGGRLPLMNLADWEQLASVMQDQLSVSVNIGIQAPLDLRVPLTVAHQS